MAVRAFSSPGAFGVFLASLPARMAQDTEDALEQAARLVEAEAKASIGEYQQAAGPFGPWPPLAPSTVAQKEKLGYAPPDNPLLRTGEMRESIEHNVDANPRGGEAAIGSDSEIAVYQELGTREIPPRSFLGSAAARRADDIARIIGQKAIASLRGDNGTEVPIPIP